MKETKKQRIRKVLKYYARLLMLKDYRVYSRFKTAAEDPEVKGNMAVIHIDEDRKVLYLKLNRYLFNRMKMREVKRYILHELLHSLFGELSIFFESVVREGPYSDRKKKALVNKFDELEHRKINYLINLMLSLDGRKSLQ
ncbi:MAG: hypothetical protein GF408_05110 [Candidatus Omnitrophica bacterium]|nr:hypothetical protein [Candidatus Omnitrophota bacterium]